MQEFARTAQRAAITLVLGIAATVATAMPAAAAPDGFHDAFMGGYITL